MNKNLTENQIKVLEALTSPVDLSAIASLTELDEKVVTPTINSLVKAGLIAKNEDGTYSLLKVEEAGNGVSQETSEKPEPSIETSEGESQLDDKVKEEPILVVVPYSKDISVEGSLQYLLRGLYENLKEDFKVVVVGDKEEWFSDELIHLPVDAFLIKEVCNCPSPSLILNPEADITNKLLAVVASLEHSGKIILHFPNTVILAPVDTATLEIPKLFHEDLIESSAKVGLYAQNSWLAGKELANRNLPTKRYGTFTPVVFDSEKLIEVIEAFNATENGYPIESMYFNYHYPNARPMVVANGGKDCPVLASVYRSTATEDVISNALKNRTFLNFNDKGWHSVKKWLKTNFKTPSPFEK